MPDAHCFFHVLLADCLLHDDFLSINPRPFKNMKDYAKQFYHSKAWLKCREAFISNRILIDGGMCQCCHERLGYIVHHKTELTPQNITDPEIALNWRNMQYVCHECHNEIHDAFTGRADIMFDSNGDVIAKPRRADPPV